MRIHACRHFLRNVCSTSERAVNCRRTASRDFAEFLSGVLTECLGFTRSDVFFVHVSNWAGDPLTRKGTSCTLSYVDQFLLASECQGQGTDALSSGESELCALGALSSDLIFSHAIVKEIGPSFLVHARADSSTARALATKHGASRKMTHIHTGFLCTQDLVFPKLLTTSAVKRDVDPSDVETKGLRRERFCRMKAVLGLGNELRETHSLGSWDDESYKSNVCRVLRLKKCTYIICLMFSYLIEGRFGS